MKREIASLELGVDEDEAQDGILSIQAVHLGRLALVVLETDDDLLVGGIAVNRLPEVARAKARKTARQRLAMLRSKWRAGNDVAPLELVASLAAALVPEAAE